MNKTDPESDRISAELLEMALALSSHSLITQQEFAEIKVLCEKPPLYMAETVAAIRKNKANMSQSVFAAFMNVSVSTVQKWEAPESGKHPSGAAAKLLQMIDKKGIEAIV